MNLQGRKRSRSHFGLKELVEHRTAPPVKHRRMLEEDTCAARAWLMSAMLADYASSSAASRLVWIGHSTWVGSDRRVYAGPLWTFLPLSPLAAIQFCARWKGSAMGGSFGLLGVGPVGRSVADVGSWL